MKKQNLKGKSLRISLLVIMEENKKKVWTPYKLQHTIRVRTGRLYSESSITAALRYHHIPAEKPVDYGKSTAWTYSLKDF